MYLKSLFSIVTAGLLFTSAASYAQSKYFDKNSDVSFYSHTPIEDIDAKNSSAVSVLDVQSGAIEFSVLIKAFAFDKALMQEHFNENYMESEKYPKATFKGQVKNISSVNLKADGTYTADVSGTLTMHGVSKEISTTATFIVKGGSLDASTAFAVNPEDYNISIPGVVKEKIAKQIEVKVSSNFQPYVN